MYDIYETGNQITHQEIQKITGSTSAGGGLRLLPIEETSPRPSSEEYYDKQGNQLEFTGLFSFE